MTWKYEGKTSAFNHLKFDGRSDAALEYGLNPKLFKQGPVCLTHQSVVMLASLNEYDQMQVMKEIHHVTQHPRSSHSIKHSANPFVFLYRCRYPFRNYHYDIRYKLAPAGDVVIEDIFYDHALNGHNQPHRDKGWFKPAVQRPMLYRVSSTEYVPYDGPKTREQLDDISGAWKASKQSVHEVRTEHAAVNGMLNDFKKAAWLMGVHSQAAYPNDGVTEYTLVHNPSDGTMLDFIECAFDKRKGRKSHNAQQLAAVMRQCKQQGRKVKWTVHSQGTIIFCAAMEELRKRGCTSLQGQQVVIHGSGASVERTMRAAARLGLHVSKVSNNPFDIVPNLAGGNNRSGSGLKRSMQFCGLVTSDKVPLGVSPHTLPYLGAETYRTQLQMLGFTEKAAKVGKYIEQQAGRQKHPYGNS